jgi:hypothetical protein
MGRAIPRMGSRLGLSQWSSIRKQLHDPDELFRLPVERHVPAGFEHVKTRAGHTRMEMARRRRSDIQMESPVGP